MKVTREKVEDSQAFLNIEMEPAEVEDARQAAYLRLVKKAKVPGFRKGKAPREVLQRHVGKDKLLEEALNKLIPEVSQQAIKEQGLEAITWPDFEIVQTDPLIFKAIVPLKPTVKLGDYHSIRIKPETVVVKKEDVAAAIEEIRHQQALWEPVERPVQFGDLLIFDVEAQVEGKPLIDQKSAQYQLLPERPYPLPGFAEQIVGIPRGEAKEFKLGIPPDYPHAELAGKEASFKVLIIEIKEEKLPELNDEFAGRVSPSFKTLAALRKQVTETLKHRAQEKARVDHEDKVVEAVAEGSQVEFPPVVVTAEVGRIMEQYWREGRGLEEYLKKVNKTEPELREELKPAATQRVKRSLVLGQVSKEEKVEVSDAEVAAEEEKIKQGVTNEKDMESLEKYLKTEQARESIVGMLMAGKTVDRLVAIATSGAAKGRGVAKARAATKPKAKTETKPEAKTGAKAKAKKAKTG